MSDLLLFLAAEAPKYKWGIFRDVKGCVFGFLVGIALFVLTYIMIQRARAGLKIPEIRHIPGLEAFEEAVGRATEMGRPVHITDYYEYMGDYDTFAFWSYLSHVAKLCASYDTRIINTNSDYLTMVVNEEIIRQAYLEAGRPDAFNRDDVRFLSDWQFGYTMGVAGIVAREKPAAQFLIGYFYAEALIIAESGNLVGAVQVAATSATAQMPFFVAACDYTLIGEEYYAGAALLSKEPVIYGSVVAEDLMRVAFYALIIAGAILATLKVDALRNAVLF
ncbi:MAG TPA: hypothetical protein GX510_02760 [Firmicutes bacterium]|nr:hypothetical protein [Candidatus Fermentithermobacillaceae bacterium]